MTSTLVQARQTGRLSRPRPLLWWALGLTGAFVLMGLVLLANPTSPFTQGLDDAWRSLVGAAPGDDIYQQPFAMFLQYLGEAPGALVMVILIPLALVIVGRWRSALFFFAADMAGMGLYSQGMKNLVDRPRPAADEAAGLFGPLFHVDHGSYPSGHAAAAGVFAVAVLALIPVAQRRLRIVWMVVGAVIMLGMIWQRTLINAHWLSDAFFGVTAGAAAAMLMWWAFWPQLQRDHVRPVWFLRAGDRQPA